MDFYDLDEEIQLEIRTLQREVQAEEIRMIKIEGSAMNRRENRGFKLSDLSGIISIDRIKS